MSKALERLETERLLAVKEELTATNYNQLKAKLTELGASEAWQQGEKKEIIIAKALQILDGTAIAPEVKTEVVNTEVPAKEEKPVVEPVITPVVEIKPEVSEEQDEEEEKEIIEEVKKEEVKAVVYGEDDPRNFVSKLTENISLEDLEKNLDRIQLLMIGSNNFHKMILLEKTKQIEAKIKELLNK